MNMVKLRRDIDRARTIIDLVKKREKLKREVLSKDWDVFEIRCAATTITANLSTHCA